MKRILFLATLKLELYYDMDWKPLNVYYSPKKVNKLVKQNPQEKVFHAAPNQIAVKYFFDNLETCHFNNDPMPHFLEIAMFYGTCQCSS